MVISQLSIGNQWLLVVNKLSMVIHGYQSVIILVIGYQQVINCYQLVVSGYQWLLVINGYQRLLVINK